jgi:hypothetical protein
MRITSEGIRKMIEQIVMDERYGTGGHNGGENRALDLVQDLRLIMAETPFDLADMPHKLLRGSLAEDIKLGYGRPLSYLCSDCRYPKWRLTAAEVRAGNIKTYIDRVKDMADNEFPDIADACPKCGD